MIHGDSLVVEIQEAVQKGSQSDGHTQASPVEVSVLVVPLNFTFYRETIGFLGGPPHRQRGSDLRASWVTLGSGLEERPSLGHLWYQVFLV